MNRLFFTVLALSASFSVMAEDIDVTTMKVAGPYSVQKPFMIDSTDVNNKVFSVKDFLNTAISVNGVFASSKTLKGDKDGIKLPNSNNGLYLLGFTLQNIKYTSAKLTVDGLKDYQLFLDDEKVKDEALKLEPGTHRFTIKYIGDTNSKDKLKVRVTTEKDGLLSVPEGQNGRLITIHDIVDGRRINSVAISPNGKYLLSSYTTVMSGGESMRSQTLTELATGKVQEVGSERRTWMPMSNKYYYLRKQANGRDMITVDPLTGEETVIATNLPDGMIEIAPTEDYLIISMTQEGPKERKDIYEVLVPDDRHPGWRNRSYPVKYEFKTGMLQPLTYGYHNIYLSDISKDGKYVLLHKSEARLTKRPTTLTSIYLMDVSTLKARLLIDKDGFIGSAQFAPDGTQILISGTPECFDGIGKNVKPDQTPSMIDNQLYLMDISSKQVTPLTKYFNPSVSQFVWNKFDGQIYFNAENKDCVSLYRLNPNDKKITQLQVPEELVKSFDLAGNASSMAYIGQGAMNSDRVYTMDLSTVKSTCVEDLSATLLKDVALGSCEPWNFINSRGDTICGRFYLPPHFDKSKKYPMIVNYYGGCSPTSRNFETRYPHNLYAAMGYIVYVINPSGATGFGQEFSARHVNTAGEGVALDIMEGVKEFCNRHSFVNPKKIGCIGASYGGFMTQYLQTKTDIFAAAISHAGISDHTSYWGEGYWGYSYSEVSMANEYPWTNKELYVNRSPLFNADKIHTPLLFLHGSADHNVPIGESIQMFTALKLLGRPTAFVVVDNQDHHIMEYDKRLRWQNTIFAWFQKYLQDDDSWWEALYPKKSL